MFNVFPVNNKATFLMSIVNSFAVISNSSDSVYSEWPISKTLEILAK